MYFVGLEFSFVVRGIIGNDVVLVLIGDLYMLGELIRIFFKFKNCNEQCVVEILKILRQGRVFVLEFFNY